MTQSRTPQGRDIPDFPRVPSSREFEGTITKGRKVPWSVRQHINLTYEQFLHNPFKFVMGPLPYWSKPHYLNEEQRDALLKPFLEAVRLYEGMLQSEEREKDGQ